MMEVVMNVRVLYFSTTGHSKKIAKAVAESIGVQAEDIKENPILNSTDLLFVASGIYGGQPDPKLLSYFDQFSSDQIKKVALLTSSAGKKTKQVALRNKLNEKGIAVLENEFTCQGAFLVVGLTHPNAQDLSDAVTFSKKLLQNS